MTFMLASLLFVTVTLVGTGIFINWLEKGGY